MAIFGLSISPKIKKRFYIFVILLYLCILFVLWTKPSPQHSFPSPMFGLSFHKPRVQLRVFNKRPSCPPIYGKIVVFIMYRQDSLNQGFYGVAMESVKCYFKGRDYQVEYVDIDEHPLVKQYCSHHQQLFFKKHCAAAEFLKMGDWLMVLDADTGVVNPHHCIEEWIDDRVNLIFYERFFNWEIAAGNYLARNSRFSYDFLKRWANWEFHQPPNFNGADNGCLQIHILQTVQPDANQEIENCDTIWKNATGYSSYMAYVVCVKLALGANKLWPGKLRIYRRAHGWVRDGFLTSDRWGPSDFMLHGWKRSNISEAGWDSPFTANPKSANCGRGDEGWQWRKEKITTDAEIRKLLAGFETSAGNTFPNEARLIPHLQYPDVRKCYPHCDDATDNLF